MKLLFFYSILFIYFTFTKEKISITNNKDYNENCYDIDSFIQNYESKLPSDYAFNAEYCRLKELSNFKLSGSGSGVSGLRNLKGSPLEGDICCYISILDSTDNWFYFCGQITPSNYNDNGVVNYINTIKGADDFKNKFKDIKIDCFSKKLDIMINILLLSLICTL